MATFRNRLNFAIISCIGWFPVALYSIFIKKMNIELRFFPLFYKFSNIGDSPTLIDQLFIYIDDILFSFFLIPLLIILFVYLFPRIKTLILIALATILTLLLLFANMHSWGTVGTPLSYSAFVDAAVFAIQSPKFISMYVDYDSWLKISILIVASLLSYALAAKISKTRYLNCLAVTFVVLFFVCSFITVAVAYQSQMKKSEIFQNFIVLSLSSFIDMKDTSDPSVMSIDEAMNSFRQLTHTPETKEVSSLYGKAKGNDLIVYIIETGPVDFYDFENDLESFPAINSLADNSLISYNHYSTYPGSAQALFSLFFSIYPPQNYYQTCITKKDKWPAPFPGFVSKFKEDGYVTNLYLPYTDTIPLDKILHNNMGVDHTILGEDYEISGVTHDEMALEQMKKDVSSFIDNKQPYVAVFMPQMSHAPWKSRPDNVSVKEYGRKLGIIQDGWISGVIELLKKKNKLDTTTIVITADHGIRTAKEDPAFNMGFIDNYSFHVPLFIYSKSAFPKPLIIKGKTSHVDISPSLIDLFGLSDHGLVQQGVPLWSDDIDIRGLFYLGDWGFDADGFSENNDYYMYNDVLDMCFESKTLRFSFKDRINEGQQSDRVKKKISTIYNIQENLFSDYMCRE